MIKWFAYIVLLLIFAPYLSSAITDPGHNIRVELRTSQPVIFSPRDTIIKKRQQEEEEKKKIKEISKAKRQSKPEKIDEAGNTGTKSKRERRPEGMERPPEIPRRNGN